MENRRAGDKIAKDFKKGEFLFIYTGAPIPGVNKTIIPKENFFLRKTDNSVIIKRLIEGILSDLKETIFKKNLFFKK